jgi:hypothetical protein
MSGPLNSMMNIRNSSETLSFYITHRKNFTLFGKVLEKMCALKQDKMVEILPKSAVYTAHLILTSNQL